jgi:hypothetical protein
VCKKNIVLNIVRLHTTYTTKTKFNCITYCYTKHLNFAACSNTSSTLLLISVVAGTSLEWAAFHSTEKSSTHPHTSKLHDQICIFHICHYVNNLIIWMLIYIFIFEYTNNLRGTELRLIISRLLTVLSTS